MAPVGLYSRLKAYYTGEKEPEPAITTTIAVLILIAYTLIYVVPFYLSTTTRPSATLSRDAPSVIRGRIRSVTISCIICSISTFVFLTSIKNGNPLQSLHKMGYFPIGWEEIVKTLGLTAVLFLGPLFEAGVVEGQWRGWIKLRGLNAVISGWIGWRNFVAGPITEEILFRSCSVPLLLLSHTSNTKIIFLTPIIFGLAHVHHFYEFRITHPHTPVVAAIARSVLQFTYTTLFGGYATFIYLRTSSLVSCVVVHAFCNFMGFPRFWGKVTAGEETIIGPDVGEGKRDDRKDVETSDLSVLWTVAYYILLVGGAVGWWKCLWVLTESESSLVDFK